MTRLLVVDDDEQNRYMLQALLMGHGYEVILAADGAEAIEKARDNPPDLIISDILMPGMDGYALCRRWKRDERLKEVPFVFYTATYTDPKDEQLALNMGAERFVLKPKEPEELLDILEKVIKEQEAGLLTPSGKPVLEETVYFKEYNEALVRKLEDKLVELESAKAFLESEVAERKRVEEELRFKNAVLTAQQETAPGGILVVSYEAHIISHNQHFVEMMGVSPEVLESGEDARLLQSVTHKMADPDAFLARVRYLYEHPEEKSHEELALTDGRVFDRYSTTIFDPNGKNYGRVWYFRDITEHKRAEEALRASEAKFRSIVDNIGIGVALIGTEMQILELNRQMREWFPNIRTEEHPLCHRAFNSPPNEGTCSYCPTIQTLRDGKVHEATTATPHQGDARNYRIVSSPIHDDQGRVVAAIEMVDDITERLLLQQQLNHATKMESIGQLAGGVAHDFNNILQGMMGYSSLLLDRLPGQDETHEFAEEIAHGVERAAGLTRQLLAFSRRQVLEMEDLDLNDVVNGLTKMTRRLIGEDVKVEVMEGRRLGVIHADHGQMEQVLLNLCVNARDAMPEGGTLTIETENVVIDSEYCDAHAWASPGCYVLLSVTDTGCGMDAQTQAHIFEPFFTTKELGKGTGLGLATVYGIVRQHQGMIQVYSELGKGTTFKVYLPSFENTASPAETKVVERARGGTETILAAEDNETLRKLAARILESAGYTVLLAADGKEALAVFEKHAKDVDLLLLDVIMPQMGGKAVYDVLCRQHPYLRFLFSSGYSADAIHANSVLEKGFDLIQKPYAPDALLRKVREVLDRTTEKGSLK